MKRMLMLVLSAMVAGSLTQAQTVLSESEPADRGFSRLEIGTRILYAKLLDDTRGTGTDTREDNYLGSIDMLDVEQDYAPTRLYAQYFFVDCLGIGVSYDRIEADAGDEGGSDGIVGMDGPILYAVGRYDTGTAFTPFAEVGVALYQSYFDEAKSWADDGEYRRYMEVDDATALVLAVGCDYNITDALSVNLYARVVTGTAADAAHYNTEDPGDPRQTGEFELDYMGFGVGVKYAFF